MRIHLSKRHYVEGVGWCWSWACCWGTQIPGQSPPGDCSHVDTDCPIDTVHPWLYAIAGAVTAYKQAHKGQCPPAVYLCPSPSQMKVAKTVPKRIEKGAWVTRCVPIADALADMKLTYRFDEATQYETSWVDNAGGLVATADLSIGIGGISTLMAAA